MNYNKPVSTGNKLDDDAINGEGTHTIWYFEPNSTYARSLTYRGKYQARYFYDRMVESAYTMLSTRP